MIEAHSSQSTSYLWDEGKLLLRYNMLANIGRVSRYFPGEVKSKSASLERKSIYRHLEARDIT